MARTKPSAKTNGVKREPDSEVRGELRSACDAGDIQRVAELIDSGSITAADATAGLEDTCDNLPLMRLLLENGANPAVCATTRCMGESIELVKLLVEFGCDIKGTGHWVLQFVVEQRCRDYTANILPGITPTPESPSTGCLTRVSISTGLTTSTRTTAQGSASGRLTSP
jgi:hypothetical protein